jgi:hypothetical protein
MNVASGSQLFGENNGFYKGYTEIRTTGPIHDDFNK